MSYTKPSAYHHIRDLALRNMTAQVCLTYYHQGIWTWEEMLFNLTTRLMAENRSLYNTCVNKKQSAATTLVGVPPSIIAVLGESYEMLEGKPSKEAIETVQAMLASAMKDLGMENRQS